MTRGKKILVGCLVAVAAMVLSVFLLVVFFISWLRSPGPDLDGQRLVDAETQAYVELRLRQEDPVVRDLLRTFLSERNQAGMEALDQAQMPSAVRRFMPMFQQLGAGEVRDRDLDQLLPLGLFLTLTGDRSSDSPALLAVNFPSSGNVLSLIDWVLSRAGGGDGDLQVARVGEEVLYRLGSDTPGWFSIVGTDVLFAQDQEAVSRAIRNLQRVQPDQVAGLLVEQLAGAPADTTLRLATVEDGAAALPDMLAPWAPGLAELLRSRLAGADSVSGWGRLESTDRLAGHLMVASVAPADAEASALSRYTLEIMDGTLSFTLADAGVQGDGRRQWDFAVTGVEELIRLGARRLSGDGIHLGP